MNKPTVVVVGAGAGGLAAAVDLARHDVKVILFEAASTPGGKMRQVDVSGSAIDAGPTVFTMRWVFEGLFKDAASDFSGAVNVRKASVLARHAWTTGGELDLHASVNESADAIANLAGASEAQGFLRFCQRSAAIHDTLRDTFMSTSQPSPLGLVRRVGITRLGDLLRTMPQRTLWSALDDYFADPRLRQLFGRYSTYVGSSPLHTPATLMLIAHVEQDGVWLLPGGMFSLAKAIADLGEALGVESHYDTPVERITCSAAGRITGVDTPSGHVPADSVIFAGDSGALSSGLLGDAVSGAVPKVTRRSRGLSAITWCIKAPTKGFDLHYHNVFFDRDYPREFTQIFTNRTIAERPTVYVCAQDRLNGHAPNTSERLLILINAPADGDRDTWPENAVTDMQERALGVMRDCGLTIDMDRAATQSTTPHRFAHLFPGSGGSLYGKASHGMMASFARPCAESRVPGLFLAGGTVHPGPGVPMATLSGRLAARAVLSDLSQ